MMQTYFLKIIFIKPGLQLILKQYFEQKKRINIDALYKETNEAIITVTQTKNINSKN